MTQAAAHGADEVRAALEAVLAREGIGDVERPNALAEWFADVLDDLGIGSLLGDAGEWILWIGAACFVAVIAVAAARWLRGRADGGERAAAHAERARRVDGLRQRSREAEARGELALALRLELFALVVGLGECGELEFRPAWTNREILARGAPAPALAARLAAELDRIEPVTWGSREVGRDALPRLRRLADELLAGAAA